MKKSKSRAAARLRSSPHDCAPRGPQSLRSSLAGARCDPHAGGPLMTDFPYPGDDPADLASASSTFDANVTNMHTLIGAVNDAESNIKGSWKGETATAASGDIAKINKVLTLT